MAIRRSVYRVPAADEETFTAGCWQRGCLGLEIKPDGETSVLIEVYEDEAVAAPAGGLPATLSLLRAEPVPEQDWMAPYREHVRPFPVGKRFLLDPREPQPLERDAGGRIWLRLPARSAFGTGSHESTRLVLELLEGVPLAGRSVLDVGTGTGILAFAALQLGAASATAHDNDVLAPLHAAINARLNGVRARLFAGTLAALRDQARFDVALVNVVPEQILPEIADLGARLVPGATVVFSGILRHAGPDFLRRLRRHGFTRTASRMAAEWVAYRTRFERAAR